MEDHGYKITGVLGRGTYGTVYLCNNRFDEKCVIKQISLPHESLESAKQFLKMVNQEIYLLKNLQHPRIIRLINSFLIENGNYICLQMEYAKYGTLKQLIARHKSNKRYFKQSKILEFFCDILFGMEYLHIKNVIHRDLKSENILLSENGRIKIADFGIASVNWNYSKTKEPIGTPYYMPPETIQYNDISFASDIWALGCILYEFCMLGHPFGIAKTKTELLEMTLNSAYVPLRYSSIPYDIGMENLIKIQLEPNKNKRATISKIICDPMIMGQYYNNYFQFD